MISDHRDKLRREKTKLIEAQIRGRRESEIKKRNERKVKR